jgi:hypothetical protein
MHKDQPTPSNRLNFTKQELDRLTLPSEGVAYFYDKATKGLAISVGKTGRKSFLLYRRIQGKPERIKIGRYPDVTIDQARKTVAALNAKIAQDLNPAESMRDRRKEITLGEFFKESRAALVGCDFCWSSTASISSSTSRVIGFTARWRVPC